MNESVYSIINYWNIKHLVIVSVFFSSMCVSRLEHIVWLNLCVCQTNGILAHMHSALMLVSLFLCSYSNFHRFIPHSILLMRFSIRIPNTKKKYQLENVRAKDRQRQRWKQQQQQPFNKCYNKAHTVCCKYG